MVNTGYRYKMKSDMNIEHFTFKRRVLSKDGADLEYMVPWSIADETMDNIDKKARLIELRREEKILQRKLNSVREEIYKLQSS